MDALRYETFIRGAFGYVINEDRQMLERSEDPARLANADYFSVSNINKVKAATAYAMGIYRSEVVNFHNCSDTDHHLIDELISNVIGAESLSVISEAIEQYKSQIVRKYLS